MNGYNDLLFRRAAKEAMEEGIITPRQYEKLIHQLELKQASLQKEHDDQIKKAKASLTGRQAYVF